MSYAYDAGGPPRIAGRAGAACRASRTRSLPFLLTAAGRQSAADFCPSAEIWPKFADPARIIDVHL